MAKEKKGFLLYADIIHMVVKLPDDKAGQLFKLILAYVNDQNPSTDDLLLDLAFTPIQLQLKRDLKNWEDIKEKRRRAGKKGGEATASKAEQDAPNSSKLEQMIANDSKPRQSIAVNVNDNVSVNVNDSVSVIGNNTAPPPVKIDIPQGNAPDLETIQRVFFQQGGTPEMAGAFFNKYTAVGWKLNGSAIINPVPLATQFILNWQKNEAHDKRTKKSRGPITTGTSVRTTSAGF